MRQRRDVGDPTSAPGAPRPPTGPRSRESRCWPSSPPRPAPRQSRASPRAGAPTGVTADAIHLVSADSTADESLPCFLCSAGKRVPRPASRGKLSSARRSLLCCLLPWSALLDWRRLDRADRRRRAKALPRLRSPARARQRTRGITEAGPARSGGLRPEIRHLRVSPRRRPGRRRHGRLERPAFLLARARGRAAAG